MAKPVETELGGSSRRGRDRLLFWAALALALLPLAVSIVTAVQRLDGDYYAAGDLASIELKADDVFHHFVPTGLFSRDGWDHPGPAMFYVLALPYAIARFHTWGIHLGAVLVNGGCIVGMALIARRRGGTPLFLSCLVGAGLLIHSLGPDFVRDPWNPLLPVLPFGLLVFLAWEMTCGSAWALPAAGAVASFCVQTHVGYGLLALPLLVWGSAWLFALCYRTGQPTRRELLRAVGAVAVVLAVMWVPPLVQEVFDGEGNLSAIANYFLNDEDKQHHTATEGYRLMSSQFGWPPQWLTGHYDNDAFSGEPTVLQSGSAIPVLIVPLVLACVVLWRFRVPNARRFTFAVAIVLGLGVVWVARTLGPVFGYRVAWVSVVGMVAFLPMAWALWVLLEGRFHAAGRYALTAVSFTALVVYGVLNAGEARQDPATAFQEPWSEDLAATVPAVVRALPDRAGDVVVRCDGDPGCIYMAGLFLELDQRGLRPRANTQYGVISSNAPHRVHRTGPVRAVLRIAYDLRVDELTRREDLRLIAYRGESSVSARADIAREVERLDEEHRRGELSDLDWFLTRAPLTQRLGRALGVFIELQQGPDGEV